MASDGWWRFVMHLARLNMDGGVTGQDEREGKLQIDDRYTHGAMRQIAAQTENVYEKAEETETPRRRSKSGGVWS
jgi:hypothetical protein